jgi:hypothetical protein
MDKRAAFAVFIALLIGGLVLVFADGGAGATSIAVGLLSAAIAALASTRRRDRR